ncbi:hypothetical protein GCM10020255_093250 [Rhodococcus baikonurensis]
MHAIAAKAVAFKEAMTPEYRWYAQEVVANASALAQSLEARGLRTVSGGTDTHLALLDLRASGSPGSTPSVGADWLRSRSTRMRFRSIRSRRPSRPESASDPRP